MAIIESCKALGCRVLWSYAPPNFEGDGDPAHINVDHITPTTSGSEVCVMRIFPGDIVRSGPRWTWTDEQRRQVTAWVEQLHRMPLDEVP